MSVTHYQVSHHQIGTEAFELVLTATDNSQAVWRRFYSNRLEMGFDALQMGLIEKRPSNDPSEPSRSVLRNEVDMEEQHLKKFGFVCD